MRMKNCSRNEKKKEYSANKKREGEKEEDNDEEV